MAKSIKKNIALRLRKRGESIKAIAKRLKVSKSSVSFWCRDIKLTLNQIEVLHRRMVKGGYRGRLKGARLQYEQRLKRVEEGREEGKGRVGTSSDRDLLIAGAALYWAEGQRKGTKSEVRFCNSDPNMVKFIIEWFRKSWGIEKDRLTLRIGINKIHKDRISEVEDYWSRTTGIPKKQFRKTTFIKTKNKKIYDNFSIHYGTIKIRIIKPGNLYNRIIGLIEAISKSVNMKSRGVDWHLRSFHKRST